MQLHFTLIPLGSINTMAFLRLTNRRMTRVVHAVNPRWFSVLPNRGVDDNESILPVLIVGAGPVGLVLSMLLSKFGVRCAVLEKSKSFSRHPQAHFINNRSMEIFRKLDGLADEIQQLQPPVDLWRKFIYCTSLSGSILGSVDHMQPQDFERVVSPVSVAHFSQHKLTRLLLKKLKNIGFRITDPDRFVGPLQDRDILMGHECLSFSMTDKYINVTSSFQKDGQVHERDIQCGILVGADGARSTVRKLAGIEMKGERDLQKLVSVHFVSQELGRYLLKERPGMLFFVFNTQAIGVLVAHDLEKGEFVLQVPFYPPQQIIEDFNPKTCEKLIFELTGREVEDLAVLDIKPWVMHAEVADKSLSSNNRIILAGDAAHRFPPAGGFGMNTGIQDVHNLAWKLAMIVSGVAPTTLLSTYETERKPIASFNTALSIQNFKAAMEVPAALGLDPTVANSVHRLINDGAGSILPSGVKRLLLDGIFSVGRAQLSKAILNERNPLGSLRLTRLKHIFEEGKSLQLQFPAEDLGFRYMKGALVSDRNVACDTENVPTGRRRDYIPSSSPGSRLPHMKVKPLSSISDKDSFSTLDLVSGDKVEFLLIIAPIKPSFDLASAALNVAKKFKVLVKVCVIWPDDGNVDLRTDMMKNATASSVGNRIDVVEVKKSPTSPSWWDLCLMNEKGAILVRPDEHIAWRTRSEIEDPVAEMVRVFSTVLCLTE